MTLKDHANFGLKLNFGIQISPPKIGQFLSSGRKVPTFKTLLLCFVWKVNYLNQTTFTGVLFCDTEEPCKLCAKTEYCSPKKPSKIIDQFLSSDRKVPKFQIWFHCFAWKVNYLNQTTFTGVLFCDTEEACKLWAKTEFCFPNQHNKNCSISFQQAKRVQISYFIAFLCQKGKLLVPKIFARILFRDTEAPCTIWTKTRCCFSNKHPKNFSVSSERMKRAQMSDCISLFCPKSKLPEQNDLHRSFILWHWRAMQV